MKILIAIMSCWAHEENGDNQAVRDTWLTEVPLDVEYRFFLGLKSGLEANHIPDDVVVLNAGDYRAALAEKSKAIHEWGLRQGYDFVFKTDRDVYVDVGALLASGFRSYDYSGYIHPAGVGTKHGFLGGLGYWTSRRACDIISHSALVPLVGEDAWIGHVLGEAGIKMVGLPHHDTAVAIHAPFPFGQYDNAWMREQHRIKQEKT